MRPCVKKVKKYAEGMARAEAGAESQARAKDMATDEAKAMAMAKNVTMAESTDEAKAMAKAAAEATAKAKFLTSTMVEATAIEEKGGGGGVIELGNELFDISRRGESRGPRLGKRRELAVRLVEATTVQMQRQLRRLPDKEEGDEGRCRVVRAIEEAAARVELGLVDRGLLLGEARTL